MSQIIELKEIRLRGNLHWGTFERILSEAGHFIGSGARSFRLNLRDVTFVKPIAAAGLAALAISLKEKGFGFAGVEIPASRDAHSYLSRIDFYKAVRAAEDINMARHSAHGRFVELNALADISECGELAGRIVEVVRTQIDLDERAQNAVEFVLAEITENIFHHARSAAGGFVCCQSYRDHLAIAVVDLGVGIQASLGQNPNVVEMVQQRGPLLAAIQPKMTGRPAFNSGLGLFWTSELVKACGGVLGIHSWDNRLSLYGENVQQCRAIPWPGTAIHLLLRKNNKLNVKEIFERFAPESSNFEFLG